MTAAEASTSMAASTSTSLAAPTSERQPRQQPEDEVVKRTIKRRPARKQVGVDEIEKKQPAQNGQTFNVWYNKCAWSRSRSRSSVLVLVLVLAKGLTLL